VCLALMVTNISTPDRGEAIEDDGVPARRDRRVRPAVQREEAMLAIERA